MILKVIKKWFNEDFFRFEIVICNSKDGNSLENGDYVHCNAKG